MKVSFVTTNKYKFKEVADILSGYSVQLKQLDMDYNEDHDDDLEEIVEKASKQLVNQLKENIILEDTGLFFEAYNGFPGALPKFVFNTIGFKGIFKLLENENRGAYFKTVAAFCEPDNDPIIFEGIMKGKITKEVRGIDEDCMPYDKIFIPDGKQVTVSEMTLEEKNSFSQRAQAFQKFGEYIKSKK